MQNITEILHTPRQVNWEGEELLSIFACINLVFFRHNLPIVSFKSGKTFKSNYTEGKYGNKTIWWITDKDIPQLFTDITLINDLNTELRKTFPDYCKENTIKVWADTSGILGATSKASIKIILGNLKENCFSHQDLLTYKAGDIETINRLNKLEARMFKRSGDTRTPVQRFQAFEEADLYEAQLVSTKLKNIANLTLAPHHSTKIHTIDPDYRADFIGLVNDNLVSVEGKSTKANIAYNSDTFTEQLHSLINNYDCLGSLHNADYCLLFLKQTNEVVCFNCTNLSEHWLAGFTTIKEALNETADK